MQAIWWGAVLVPMRTLVWMLLHVREGSIRAYAHAHNGAVHARDLTRAGLVRASGGLEWVQAGGLQALWEERRLRVERRVASFRFGVVKWYDVLVMRWWSWRLATANLYAQVCMCVYVFACTRVCACVFIATSSMRPSAHLHKDMLLIMCSCRPVM